MIAWKLSANFDEQRHLFSEKIVTDYIVEAFICSCGHTDFLIKHSDQKLDYVCTACENGKFYDADSAWRNIDHFIHQNLDLTLTYEYDIQSDDNAIRSMYVTKIPRGIDFSSRKVIFLDKPVYSFVLDSDGELKENYALKFRKEISAQLQENLVHHVNKHGCFNIPNPEDKELHLRMIRFFLKNRHLREFDLYFWDSVHQLDGEDVYIDDGLKQISNHRKEKSIKVALYQNYLRQLDHSGNFYSSFIEAFTRAINDVNIIVSFLKTDFEYSLLRGSINAENLYFFMCFLKKNYTEIQILRLFLRDEFSSNISLFSDTVNELNYDRSTIESKFIKVPCKVIALHDEFVRCAKEERYKHMQHRKLKYSKDVLRSCIEIDSYEVRLPRNGKELYDWAGDLQNCMAGYFDMIVNDQTAIYGFFKKNTLMFAVEIMDKELVQASGKHNADLAVVELELLHKWYKQFFGDEQGIVPSLVTQRERYYTVCCQ